LTGDSHQDVAGPWPSRAGKTVKGLFVALALVVALEHDPDPLITLLALVGAVVAFTAGELYDAAIEAQILRRRQLLAGELRAITVEQSFIGIGGAPTVVIFALSAAGLHSAATADTLAVWAGVLILGGLGFSTGRLGRQPWPRCLLYGAESAIIGLLIVGLKTLVKKF
jgi:hypothetical protein